MKNNKNITIRSSAAEYLTFVAAAITPSHWDLYAIHGGHIGRTSGNAET